MDDDDSDEGSEDELNESDTSHEEFIETPPRKRIRRQRITADDLWKSPWGILLRNPEVADPTSLVGTKFRLRFINVCCYVMQRIIFY